MKNYIQSLFATAALVLAIDVACADVVAVVSSSSPVTALSTKQIADIFLGKSARFPDGSVAIPVDQAESSAERTDFYTRYAAKTPVEMKMHWSKLIFTGRGQPPRQVRSATEVKALLASQPNAISYLDRSLVDASLTVLDYR